MWAGKGGARGGGGSLRGRVGLLDFDDDGVGDDGGGPWWSWWS